MKNNMKKIYCSILILLISCAFTLHGQSFRKGFPRVHIGIHTGLDIGAAAPYPLSAMGEGNKISAVPYLTPALGFSGRAKMNDRWSLAVEATYKSFGIDAEAWVTDQRFRDPDDRDFMASFRGTTDLRMKFSMLEVPLYLGYSFGSCRGNKVILGPYYAKIFRSDFSVTPRKGVITGSSGYIMVSDDEPYDPQRFDDDLSGWDIGGIVGYERRLMSRVNLGLRLAVGMKDIFKPGQSGLDFKMIHMRGSVVLSYALFDIR